MHAPGNPVTEPDFDAISAHLAKPYAHLTVQGPHRASFPDRGNAAVVCDLLLNQLFPGFFADREAAACVAPAGLRGLHTELEKQIRRSLRFIAHADRGEEVPDHARIHDEGIALADAAICELPAVLDLLTSDVEAAFDNDPAAFDHGIIILSYPCIEALAIQRFAHRLYTIGVPLLPRMLTEVAHSRTGIDIHPGARIGPSFFIDHGTGVVIGETCTIGAHCVLYQGVTLGAWNPTAKDSDGVLQRGAANKRHPDLEDHVTVYPGATILGGGTVIGHHSVIGGKVVLSHSVEPYSLVVVEEPKLSIRRRKA
jgi:serine O-acetyltransferase